MYNQERLDQFLQELRKSFFANIEETPELFNEKVRNNPEETFSKLVEFVSADIKNVQLTKSFKDASKALRIKCTYPALSAFLRGK